MTFKRHILVLILFFTALRPYQSGAETICFLLTEYHYQQYHDSLVVPLSKPEDIAYARRLMTETNNPALHYVLLAKIAPGADGINRNYLATGAPEWSWHVSEFLYFGDGGIPELCYAATQIEWDPEWIVFRNKGVVIFLSYRIASELGPLLTVAITNTPNNLILSWPDLGTQYKYTLESKATVIDPWLPVAGANWPLQTNQWTLPTTNSTAQYYRVKAQLAPPYRWPPN